MANDSSKDNQNHREIFAIIWEIIWARKSEIRHWLMHTHTEQDVCESTKNKIYLFCGVVCV